MQGPLTFRTIRGRLAPAGGTVDWNHVWFQPEDGSQPLKLRLRAGAEGFFLHGVIALQPDLIVSVEILEGNPVVFIDVVPAFAREFSFTAHDNAEIPMRPANPVLPTASEPTSQEAAPAAGEGEAARVERGPSAQKIHHPAYVITAAIVPS